MGHGCRPLRARSVIVPLALTLCAVSPHAARCQASTLPNAPSTVFRELSSGSAEMSTSNAEADLRPPASDPLPCPAAEISPEAEAASASASCAEQYPLRRVVDSNLRQSLTSSQKGVLAVRGIVDPLNLAVVAGEAGVAIGSNAHTAYGPGLKGFGRLTGYDLLGESTGEFFGTFLIPSLTHEDPRYRRMQNASVKRRVFHALARTFVAEHDDGRTMPNYATLLTYPITAELGNLYVPGGHTSGEATMRRIGVGIATDPIGNLIAEFLPDIARRVHVRSLFIQQIVNEAALNSTNSP
jgi:hypothetical protein